MKKILLPFVFISTFLAGCVATGPEFVKAREPTKDKALIYIFRESKFSSAGASTTIKFNGKETVELINGGYIYEYMPAGEYEIQVAGTIVIRKYTFEAGKTYYFENTATYWESVAYYGTRFELDLIEDKVGQQKIQETNLIGSSFFKKVK